MSYQYNPRSNQETHNEMMEDQELYEELILSNNKEKLTKPQDSPSMQMELSPSITTPIEEQQNESSLNVNSEVLENLMSTLPPELSQILATVIPQLGSESNLLDLVSMMNSQMDGEISDSVLESLEGLFQ